MAMVFNPKDPRTSPGRVVHDCGRIIDFLSEYFTLGRPGESFDISEDASYGLWAILSGVSEVLIEASEMIGAAEDSKKRVQEKTEKT